MFSLFIYQLRSDSFATLWTIARQAPLSMGFSRQEYWSGLPFPPPEDLPDPGIKPVSLASPVLAGRFSIAEPPGKPGNEETLLNNSGIKKKLRGK